MGHRPAAITAPPISLGIRGNKWSHRTRIIMVVSLHGNRIGISICRLYFMHIKPRREEQHRLSARRHQRFINIRRYPAGPGQDPQGGRFQDGKVPVAPAHAHHRLDVQPDRRRWSPYTHPALPIPRAGPQYCRNPHLKKPPSHGAASPELYPPPPQSSARDGG